MIIAWSGAIFYNGIDNEEKNNVKEMANWTKDTKNPNKFDWN